jgi:hypothetical protein
MRWRIPALLIGVLALTTGCASSSKSAEVPVTEFKQVVGVWNGWIAGGEGTPSRVRLVVQSNGKYWTAVEGKAGFQGQLTLEGGALRYSAGPNGQWRGRAVLEEREKEHLRFLHDTGEVWMEYERAP